MTLVEVMIAMAIITFFTLSAFSLTLFNRRRTMANFYRLEAYRLAQSIAEHAMQVTFPTNFTPTYLMATNDPTSATQYIWTGTERAMLRSSSLGNNITQFTYPTGSDGVVFTKTITDGATIGTARVLNVQVSWTFAGRGYNISIPVVRGGN
jgi:Tfp pilus assembly protein PilV